jgi:hypothetical protein
MDRARNPFAPGAGTRPPELAGRESIIDDATVALKRVIDGRPAKSQLLLGLRGVGKTVLLNRIAEIAEAQNYLTVVLEAPESRRLAEMLVPPLRATLFKLSGIAHARELANRGIRVLRSFASAFKVKYGGAEFSVEAEPGVADSGDLESDLAALLEAVARAAKAASRGVAIFIDEVQYLSENDLGALIVSIHKIAQRDLPLIVFGAGLPQLAGLVGEAKSYAERLFDFPEVGPLSPAAAAQAIRQPIIDEGVDIAPAALARIVERTERYPYFLQEWGSHAWNAAAASPITLADADRATENALRALDAGFFRVRFDRLSPRERDYVRAMAELGPGSHRSAAIADLLGLPITAAAPIRGDLIQKGMIYSPARGDTAFTVPMFDDFMRRMMPDWAPPIRGRTRR